MLPLSAYKQVALLSRFLFGTHGTPPNLGFDGAPKCLSEWIQCSPIRTDDTGARSCHTTVLSSGVLPRVLVDETVAVKFTPAASISCCWIWSRYRMPPTAGKMTQPRGEEILRTHFTDVIDPCTVTARFREVLAILVSTYRIRVFTTVPRGRLCHRSQQPVV